MTKVLLVGCGAIGAGVHLPALIKLRDAGLVEVAGLVDLTAKRAETLAGKHSVTAWGTDWQALAESTSADALSLCLPPGPNVEIAVEALRRGLHVMTEKPPGRDHKDAQRLADAARADSSRVTMVAFNRRFAPLYLRTLERVAHLGMPHLFSGRFTRPGLGTLPSDTAIDWITSDGSHTLDLAIATIGYPHTISVSRKTVGGGPSNVWTVQLHSQRGAGVLVFDYTAGRRVERFEFSGPGYDAVLELPDYGEWAQQASEVQRWKASEYTRTESPVTNYGYLGEYQAFISAIEGKAARPATDFAYAAEFMSLIYHILDCPVGEVRVIPRLETTAAGSQRALTIETKRCLPAVSAKTRPVVAVWQEPAAQVRFFPQQRLAELKEVCELRLRAEDSPLEETLAGTDVLILGWNAPVLTPQLIEQAKDLKMVVVIGASVKQACPELLLNRGVLLCSTSDAIAQSVAEYCLMGALAGLRRLTDINRQMHDGKWPVGLAPQFSLRRLLKRGEHLPGAATFKPILRPLLRQIAPPPKRTAPSVSGLSWSDLRGQTVGLVGWGHIARRFAHLVRAFNCTLLVNSDAVSAEELQECGGRPAVLGEVMGAARVISIHKGLNPRTKGLIGASELALIRPGSVIINAARGPIIQEEALLARLSQGDLVAVLDVFDQEPLPKKHSLRKLDNVILTPHIASTTAECYQRVGSQSLDIVEQWTVGGPVPAITRERLERAT